MIDELFDRNYQSGRADLHDGIDRAVARVGRSTATIFRAIHRIEFDAPWKRGKGRAGLA
ncbi:hypothetical protein H8M03_12535 [Sphingomonas sabuli]|uniref:Uncharacterized protein n=1 Tax=Sphingomonas sabuli TaxID=2764186 RepID=A0A7G9L2E1_9SPHN|nr:hypothetical protein [Sphingomonas sabuli]QNM82790.1 hypothetical protein H8M03_12535 [Sphingomonas sabuli]